MPPYSATSTSIAHAALSFFVHRCLWTDIRSQSTQEPQSPHQAIKMTINFTTRLRKAMNQENPPPGRHTSLQSYSLAGIIHEDSSARSHRRLACWQPGPCLPAIPFAIRAFCLAVHERVMRAKRIDAWTMPSGSPAIRLR